MAAKDSYILSRVGKTLLAVIARHEAWIEVLVTCVRELIDEPRLSHVSTSITLDVQGTRKRVASTEISARTQNGHIRNNTRDASRRILVVWIGAICRKNCVADDRDAGKEGVDGSSPSEGFWILPA